MIRMAIQEAKVKVKRKVNPSDDKKPGIKEGRLIVTERKGKK